MKNLSARQKAGLALSILLAAYLIITSGWGKISGNEKTIQMLSAIGLKDWVFIIGLGEIISAILFIFPATSRIGGILLSSYFGGAIVAHMSHGIPITLPSTFLIIVWIISLIKDPAFFWKEDTGNNKPVNTILKYRTTLKANS